MLSNTAQIEIPTARQFSMPAMDFILSFARALHLQEEKHASLRSAVSSILEMIQKSNSTDLTSDTIVLRIFEKNCSLVVEIINQGAPILTDDADKSLFLETSKNIDRVSLDNLGRNGQKIKLALSLGQCEIEQPVSNYAGTHTQKHLAEEDIEIRPLKPGEESSLSRLFYMVYSYNYINEYVYYPDKIRSLLDQGKLQSIVAALPDGQLLGHLGLLRWNDSPLVYEPCLGVVDPSVNSRGIFRKIVDKTMSTAKASDMHYCFFDFVTNHDRSQKLLSHYNICDMALYVGCQTSKTQAKLSRLGMGEDPEEMDRYSILYSIMPGKDYPFGPELMLPENIGELAGFILEDLNLNWTPTSRFSILPRGGDYKAHYETFQQSVRFDMHTPGRQAVQSIIQEWSSLLRNGYQFAAVDVPLNINGLGEIYDMLAEHGFFISGFIPYRNSSNLAFRFQSIGPTRVAFDKIRLYSEKARSILHAVQKDYERNCLL